MTNQHLLKKLTEEISTFVQEREWQQFHSPKNLAMALSVECAELVEIFQWKTERESYTADRETLKKIEEEIGDIMIYLTTLSLKFNIDPLQAALEKMEINRAKYPAEKVKGSAKKYSSY